MPLPTLRRLAVALLAGFLAAVTLPAAAEDSKVEVWVITDGSTVTVYGTLSSGGKGVKRQSVTAFVDGTEIGRDTTRNDGQFRVDRAMNLAKGAHSATVRFDGGGGASPTQGITEFTLAEATNAGQDPAAQPSDQPATAPAVTRPQVALTATSSEAVSGEMVTVSGRLTSGGQGLANAGISLSDAEGEVADAYTVTNGDGGYETLYLVPDEQAEGTLTLTVSFAGGGSYPAASRKVDIPVTHLDVQASDPKETEGATPAPSAAPTSTPAQTGSAQAPQVEKGQDDSTPATQEEASPMSWFLVATLVIAALAVVGLVAMVARVVLGKRGRVEAAEPGSGLAFLDDDDEPVTAGPITSDLQLAPVVAAAAVTTAPLAPLSPADPANTARMAPIPPVDPASTAVGSRPFTASSVGEPNPAPRRFDGAPLSEQDRPQPTRPGRALTEAEATPPQQAPASAPRRGLPG